MWGDFHGLQPVHNGLEGIRFRLHQSWSVYIQKDPDGKGREDLIKSGIERWVSPLAGKGVTVNIHIGPVPVGTTKNCVLVQWAKAGSLKGDANPDDVGSGTPIDDNKNHIVVAFGLAVFSGLRLAKRRSLTNL